MLKEFLRESNEIEGISRDPTPGEHSAAMRFLDLDSINIADVCRLQSAIAPGRPLRDRPDMNVKVGNYRAPRGGPEIADRLARICCTAAQEMNAWKTHVEFEALHPFLDGNGRTGRLIWAWQMMKCGDDPFTLPFLHRFYYQSLENVRLH
jgi:hypothetical protein